MKSKQDRNPFLWQSMWVSTLRFGLMLLVCASCGGDGQDTVALPSEGGSFGDGGLDGSDASIVFDADPGQPCPVPGQQRACYTGPALTLNIGACTAGSQECVGDAWSSCLGEIVPTTETCDRTDDNCDGFIDEGCACADGDTRDCYSGPADTLDVGACEAGLQRCLNGTWTSTCEGEVTPENETCNGDDDDCDDRTDENVCCSCEPHDACGDDGCGNSCGTCEGDRYCMGSKCVWDHGNDGTQTCSTICFWGHSVCVGTSDFDCGTQGERIECHCW